MAVFRVASSSQFVTSASISAFSSCGSFFGEPADFRCGQLEPLLGAIKITSERTDPMVRIQHRLSRLS